MILYFLLICLLKAASAVLIYYSSISLLSRNNSWTQELSTINIFLGHFFGVTAQELYGVC
jgi:hypothetical protein